VTVCHISAHHSSNSLTSAALVLRSATYRPHFNILKLWCVLAWGQEPQEKNVKLVGFTTCYWFQKLKRNRHSSWMVVGLRRRWRHKFWKVMVVSSTCWRKRVCRLTLVGFRAYLSICCVWKFGQEIRKVSILCGQISVLENWLKVQWFIADFQTARLQALLQCIWGQWFSGMLQRVNG